MAFIVAESCLLTLPLDVANTRTNSNVDVKILWYIIFCTSLAFIVLVLPFGIFFYETDETREFKHRLWSAFKQETITFVVCTLVVTLSFAGLSYSSVPLNMTVCTWDSTNETPELDLFLDPLVATENLKTP